VPARVDSACPDGGRIGGAVPPEGTRRGCRNQAGERHGPWTFWGNDGKKFAEGTYRQNKKHGTWRLFYAGQEIGHGEYRDNEKVGVWRERAEFWTEESSTSEPFWGYLVGEHSWTGEYVQSKREGVWNRLSGERALERGSYRDNEKEGLWTTWHESGAKASEGEYQRSQRTGAWRYWDADGKQTRVDTHDAARP